MQKKCLKCGHINHTATGLDTEACPGCGAIYSRVEAAIASGKLRPAALATPVMPAVPATAASPLDATAAPASIAAPVAVPAKPTNAKRHAKPFIEKLREKSHYPTLREVVKWMTLISYVIWGLIGPISTVFAFARGEIGVGTAGLALCIFMIVLTKVFKEVSLMVADLSDAAVLTAEKLSVNVES